MDGPAGGVPSPKTAPPPRDSCGKHSKKGGVRGRRVAEPAAADGGGSTVANPASSSAKRGMNNNASPSVQNTGKDTGKRMSKKDLRRQRKMAKKALSSDEDSSSEELCEADPSGDSETVPVCEEKSPVIDALQECTRYERTASVVTYNMSKPNEDTIMTEFHLPSNPTPKDLENYRDAAIKTYDDISPFSIPVKMPDGTTKFVPVSPEKPKKWNDRTYHVIVLKRASDQVEVHLLIEQFSNYLVAFKIVRPGELVDKKPWLILGSSKKLPKRFKCFKNLKYEKDYSTIKKVYMHSNRIPEMFDFFLEFDVERPEDINTTDDGEDIFDTAFVVFCEFLRFVVIQLWVLKGLTRDRNNRLRLPKFYPKVLQDWSFLSSLIFYLFLALLEEPMINSLPVNEREKSPFATTMAYARHNWKHRQLILGKAISFYFEGKKLELGSLCGKHLTLLRYETIYCKKILMRILGYAGYWLDDIQHAYDRKNGTEDIAHEEAQAFASYRRSWDSEWSSTCGFFTDRTVPKTMQLTFCTAGHGPYSTSSSTPETLQILSLKLSEVGSGLEFPLSVYGVVSVRDSVDRRRNTIFCCDSRDAQMVNQKDPFLHLIGPSRAIVYTDEVWFELELAVKGAAGSKDHHLIVCSGRYTGWNGPGVSTICFKNIFCKLELCLQPVEQTLQATILGVVIDGSCPLKYGGLVACSPLPGSAITAEESCATDPSMREIILFESRGEAMPKGEDGYVHLWRQVVSVEAEGRLDIVIKAYSKSGIISEEASIPFYPVVGQVTKKRCSVGRAQVTVVWSFAVASNQ